MNRGLDTPDTGCYTRPTMPQYRIKRAPRALRRPGILLDNVALVPASLLRYKKEWQAVANGLPHGSVLVCSTTNPRQQKILEQVSTHLKSKGHRVTTLSGAVRYPPPGRHWSRTEDQWLAIVAAGQAYFGKKGDGSPAFKQYLKDAAPIVPNTWGHTPESAKLGL
jgi:hypothetical protein